MKSVIVVLGMAALGGAWLAFAPCSPIDVFQGWCCSSGGDSSEHLAVQGQYFELRDAPVSLRASTPEGGTGRRALAGWKILAGAFDGQDLTGIDLVAAIESEESLADGGARRSVVYVPEGCESARSEAAVGWLQVAHAAQLGEIVTVRSAPVRLSFDGRDFDLAVEDVAHASGTTTSAVASCSTPPDAACGALANLQSQVLGEAIETSFAGEAGLSAWNSAAATNAFVGSFRSVTYDVPASACCRTPSSPCETGVPLPRE